MPFFGGTTATTVTSNPTWVTVTASTSTTMYDNGQAYNAMRAFRSTQAYNSMATNPYFQYHDPRPQQAAIVRGHPKEARDRAQALLLEHLSPAQRETFDKNKWFVVEGGKSGKKYRIEANDDLVANIAVMDGTMIRHRLCGHCDIRRVPLADHLLAQKIMLESEEDEFLRVANRHAA
jgi:hypothetical protein